MLGNQVVNSNFILKVVLWDMRGSYYDFHLTHLETEAQRGETALFHCPLLSWGGTQMFELEGILRGENFVLGCPLLGRCGSCRGVERSILKPDSRLQTNKRKKKRSLVQVLL